MIKRPVNVRLCREIDDQGKFKLLQLSYLLRIANIKLNKCYLAA